MNKAGQPWAALALGSRKFRAFSEVDKGRLEKKVKLIDSLPSWVGKAIMVSSKAIQKCRSKERSRDEENDYMKS